MTSTILVVPQAMGGVPKALGTSQHPSAMLARAPSGSTQAALPARPSLRFPSPYRGDPDPFLASNISTEVCFFLLFFTFFKNFNLI
jgi:hypothetical protein